MTKIVGLDLSMNSSGLVKLTLDDNFDIVDTQYEGFCAVKKHESDNVHLFRKKDFDNRYQMNVEANNYIKEFCKDAEHVAIEDYAFGAPGNLVDIGEYIGFVKTSLLQDGHNIRLYDPNSIKKFATDDGRSDKISMYQWYMKSTQNKPDIKSLPVPTKASGISPTSDIVDAYWIADLLRLELKLRRGLTRVQDLSQPKIEIFNRVTKAFPENILVREFLKL
jgi:Holliday junction resolvasome RuvABC endonuclease subunit